MYYNFNIRWRILWIKIRRASGTRTRNY